MDRLAKVQRVLVVACALNFVACVGKIALGLITGAMAITADGFHSLGDSLANIAGLMGIRLARRKPDEKHGYGYERFEAVTTLLVVSFISITCYKVFETGISRVLKPETVHVEPLMLLVMVGSMAVNVITVIYEGGAGKRLKSELLAADANETKSDLWISASVMGSTWLVDRTSWFWLDGAVTIAIGFMILRVIAEIVGPTARQLADAQVVEPSRVIDVVMAVPGAKFCHAVRSRGREEAFFLDLHLGVEKSMSIELAHDDVCHRAKLALHDAFPGLKSALVHIEPDNEAGETRGNSVFRDRDSYDHRQ